MAGPQWMPQWAKPETKRSKVIFGGVAVFCVLVISAFSLLYKSDIPRIGWNGSNEPDWRLDIEGEYGAVASDTGHCSQMGVDVLKKGGSAADAAVQVALCIGSMVPQSSGIGGGGFITLRYPNGSSIVIDARETAPSRAHKHMFDKDPLLSKFFGLASGVPGELAGLEKLWELGGQLDWSDLVTPVADLNEAGFPRGEALINMANGFVELINERVPGLYEDMIEKSDWCWVFTGHPKCGGRKPQADDIVKRPNLARTLRTIAKGGAKAFYEGTIAESLAKISQRTGGILTSEDIANYSVVVKPTISVEFLNRTVLTAPEPASGPALLMGLRALEHLLPEEGEGRGRELNADPVMSHRIVEIMKWMAAARSQLGDPNFISNPKIAEILTEKWAEEVVGNVSDYHTLPSWRDYHPAYEMNNPSGTTHFSVVDKNGMAVSMTSTVNLPFGNGICDPETGVVMNSEMDDFSIPNVKNGFDLMPSIYNFIQPGKRPLSSAVPSVIVSPDGEVELVAGAAGGSRILTTVFLGIARIYGFKLEALEAVSFSRFHHQLIPESIAIEPGLPTELIEGWKSRGHAIDYNPPGAVMNIVHRDNNAILHAIGDFYRKRALGAAY